VYRETCQYCWNTNYTDDAGVVHDGGGSCGNSAESKVGNPAGKPPLPIFDGPWGCPVP
jgi:hypothetical protein